MRQPVAEIDPPHLGIVTHLRRRPFGDQPALVQYRDLLCDTEYDLHVVLGEQQGQTALLGDALQQADRLVRLAGRHASGGLVEQ